MTAGITYPYATETVYLANGEEIEVGPIHVLEEAMFLDPYNKLKLDASKLITEAQKLKKDHIKPKKTRTKTKQKTDVEELTEEEAIEKFMEGIDLEDPEVLNKFLEKTKEINDLNAKIREIAYKASIIAYKRATIPEAVGLVGSELDKIPDGDIGWKITAPDAEKIFNTMLRLGNVNAPNFKKKQIVKN